MTIEKGRSSRWSNKKYLLIYTAIFTLFLVGTYASYIYARKSLVWKEDGGGQYFIYLSYVGEYLRDLFSRMMHGDFTLKMFDFTIGPGSDVNSIFRTHPLDYLSVLVRKQYTEILYHLISFSYFYFGGLLFTVFARRFNGSDKAILAGSMMYIFCGFTMRSGTMHPQNAIALCTLPLILIATEYMMTGQKPLFFAFAVCLSFISNYYMMYMVTLALGLYIIFRFWTVHKTDRLKQFFIVTFRFGVFYLMGTAMAAISLMPTIKGLGSSARLQVELGSPNLLSYSDKLRILKWITALITPKMTLGWDTPLNYLVFAIPVLGILFFSKTKHRTTLRLMVLLAVALIVMPLGSYIFTMFTSINGRWVYIFSFLIGFAAADVWEEMTDPDKRTKIIIGASWFVFMAVTFYLFRHNINWYILCAAAELTCCSAVLIWGRKIFRTDKVYDGVLLFGSFLSVCLAGGMLYAGWFGSVAGQFLKQGQPRDRIVNSSFTKALELQSESDGFARVEFDYIANTEENYGTYLGYNTTSMYNSLLSGPYVDLLYEEESVGLDAIHRVHNVDGRTVTEALMNVEWFVTRNTNTDGVPYGFEKVDKYSDDTVTVYRNKYLLPFGFTYPAAVKTSDTEELNALEKEQLMLDSAKVDEIPEGVEEAASTDTGVIVTELALPESSETVERTEKGYKVPKPYGRLEFEIERKAGYETYLRLEGLYRNYSRIKLFVETEGMTKPFVIRGEGATYTLNRRDYLVNLGTAEEDRTETISLVFESKGSYELAGVQVMYAPMEGYADQIATLSEYSLTDIEMDTNTVTGKISVPNNRVMSFSVPYSEGWSAYVDGEKTDTYKVNTGFLGITVPAGDHDIRLSYTTPGAVAGRIGSLVGWIAWIICFFVLRKKKRTSVA